MKIKAIRLFVGQWYLLVALWQLVQLASLIFCLVSNSWIVTTNGVGRKGLFWLCAPKNLSCVSTNIGCFDCNGTDSPSVCQPLHNETQAADEEIVGGLLMTSIMFRVIALLMSTVLFVTGKSSAKEFKKTFSRYIIVFEEFCGVSDVAIVGLYLFLNHGSASVNACSKFDVAFWLNLIRPLEAFVVLRFLFPLSCVCVRYCVSRNTSSTESQDLEKLNDDKQPEDMNVKQNDTAPQYIISTKNTTV